MDVIRFDHQCMIWGTKWEVEKDEDDSKDGEAEHLGSQ
jgi:hypothetical protein